MKKKYVLFNPISGGCTAENDAKKLANVYPEAELVFRSVRGIESYADLFGAIEPDADVIVCGGDGTLNKFVNRTAGVKYKNDVYYYAMGTGNDFLRDVGKETGCEPFLINDYLRGLPTVTVKGEKYRFLNNVGFGIDGYCCEVGDEMREKKKENINYTAIAIKGLLFKYRPTNATVIVDGKEYKYKKVWIAPTMKGRFYGGGMMPTPEQDRLSADGKVSVMLMHGSGKLQTLMAFPSLFKGELLKYEKITALHTGYNITVRFDSPRAVQIDGETVKDVTEYTVEARVTADKTV